MFRFHNEHRIVLTRLLSLMLLFVNGQWDPRLQQVVNAVVHSGTGVLLAAMFIAAGGRRAFVMLAPIALVFAAPFGWENTVMGFQSAFYFQLLFAILSIWLLITPRNRGEWLLGVACAFLGLGAAAGALLAPVAVIVVAALDLICDPKRVNRSSIAIVSTAAAVAAFGWWFSSPPLAHHAALRAASIGEFLTALGRNLAWPLVGRPFAAVLLWLPTSVLVVTRMVRREPLSTADRWTVGLAAWTVLQAAAIAYGRGRNGPGPASRYQDLVSMGFLANTAALLYALDLRVPAGAVRTRVALLTVAVWTVVGYVGVGRLVDGSIIELNRSTVRWGQETADLRRFVTSDDPNVLAARLPSELPHPSADVLIRVLRDPFIRTILPASIRPPIHLTPASSTVGFVEDGGAWGSFPSSGHENRFDSQLLPADSAGFLRFSVARDADHPGSTLFLKGARTGRETTVDRPGSTAAGWTDLTVRQPSEPYSVVARDSGDGSWIAFTEPVQVGSGSFVAEYLIARSATILFLSFAAAVWFVGRFTAA
jgi:hypothetical protein